MKRRWQKTARSAVAAKIGAYTQEEGARPTKHQRICGVKLLRLEITGGLT
jgi:hypothetical protein